MSKMPPPYAGHFDGRCDAAVQYRSHHPMEEVRGFHKATKCHHRASTRSDFTKPGTPMPVVSAISS